MSKIINKVNKDVVIDFIVSRLKIGESRAVILEKADKKWKIATTTFDRRLAEAKKRHQIEQDEIRKELVKVEKDAAVKQRKRQILTITQRKNILTDIAMGNVEIPVTQLRYNPGSKKVEHIEMMELPNHQVRVNAVNELNRMDGSHAPTKIAPTDTDGNNLKPESKLRVPIAEVPTEMLEALLKISQKPTDG